MTLGVLGVGWRAVVTFTIILHREFPVCLDGVALPVRDFRLVQLIGVQAFIQVMPDGFEGGGLPGKIDEDHAVKDFQPHLSQCIVRTIEIRRRVVGAP